MAVNNYIDSQSNGNGTAVARARPKAVAADILAITSDADREAHIQQLREKYRNGTYYVNSQKVASRIVDQYITTKPTTD